jgi:hypothetical protein
MAMNSATPTSSWRGPARSARRNSVIAIISKAPAAIAPAR